MSTVKTTNIQHPSSAVENLRLAADGTVEAYNGSAWKALVAGIVSIHQATKTDTQAITGSTPVTVTDLSITFTPASATNKVLLLAAPTVQAPNANITSCGLFRDGTILLAGDVAGSRTPTLTGQMGTTDRSQVMNMIYLDSPATTSSTTYDVRVASISGATTYINRTLTDTDNAVWPRFASTLVAIEVNA